MTRELKAKSKPKPRPSQAGVTYVIIPPDGGWGWVIVAASFICNFVAEGTMYSYGLFLDEIAKSLNTTTTQVSLANSLMTGFYFFFGPVICAMINRWGYRVVGVAGGVLASVAFVISSFATQISILIVSYGLLGGFGFGMLYMPSVIAIGFYFERWRGVANSVSLCGSAVGSISIPLIILVSMKDLVWQNKFRCFAGFAFFCALCTMLYKPLHPLAVAHDEDDKRNLQASIMSIRRAGSPNTMSMYSFKSYTSTTKSLFKGSRLTSFEDEGCCRTCCDTENCRHTCDLLCCCCKRKWTTNPSRPMYRSDILYTGSVANLPEYRRSLMPDALDFHVSVTRMASEKDLMEDHECCVCCPEAIKGPLSMMLDFGLFKSCAFTLVALSGFLTMLGFFIPLMYITAKCLKQGMNSSSAAYLLSTFGFAHLVGRVVCAVINFFPSIKALPVSVIFVFSAGLSTIVCVVFSHKYVQFGFCATYGMSFAMILSLRPILIVELFGLEKLSNSFGIMMMFYGLACLLGIPIAGLLYDLTNDYDLPFYFAGGAITIGGIILAPVSLSLRQEKKRAEMKDRRMLARKKRLEQLQQQHNATTSQ